MVLPNKQSPNQTAGSVRFDVHYARLGIVKRWDQRRYDRLAGFLGLTRYELASLICLRHESIDNHFKVGKFPGPAALLLTILEAQALKDYVNDVELEAIPPLKQNG